jgi:hypothetical protein
MASPPVYEVFRWCAAYPPVIVFAAIQARYFPCLIGWLVFDLVEKRLFAVRAFFLDIYRLVAGVFARLHILVAIRAR